MADRHNTPRGAISLGIGGWVSRDCELQSGVWRDLDRVGHWLSHGCCFSSDEEEEPLGNSLLPHYFVLSGPARGRTPDSRFGARRPAPFPAQACANFFSPAPFFLLATRQFKATVFDPTKDDRNGASEHWPRIVVSLPIPGH